MANFPAALSLAQTVSLAPQKIRNPARLTAFDHLADGPALVLLAAGKGTRFGAEPKCIQPVQGAPLARHSIDAFQRLRPTLGGNPVIVLVGYRADEVATALGPDNLYIHSDNPAGGTAYASYEAFCVPALASQNPLLFVTMGDRIAPTSIYQALWATHWQDGHEAVLTMLTAHYTPPNNQGKGRIVRDGQGEVVQVIEEKDIAALADPAQQARWLALTEGNCPLYLIRAGTLQRLLSALTNANAQQQYYLTDIVAVIQQRGGTIRTVTIQPGDPEYALLTADVTRPADLARLAAVMGEGRR
jgi:bifunctional UDP-N-acetylglucosamine pyrophosphorylase/glucosamine-1-phosphate N-acetyltransferase